MILLRKMKPNRKKSFGLCALTLCLSSLMSASLPLLAVEKDTSSPEYMSYKVKSAYLYNFMRLVDWPADSFNKPDSPITTCILGDDPFGSTLDGIKKKTSQGRLLSIVNLSEINEVTDNCQLLFISSSEEPRFETIFSQTGTSPILTVGELDGFIQQGGIIEFVMEADKVRFKINLKRANQAGMKINDRLLKIAMP